MSQSDPIPMRPSVAVESSAVESSAAKPSRRKSGPLAALLAAVRFLTRLPVGNAAVESAESLRQCAIYFPVVGALIGCFTCGVLGGAAMMWPLGLAVVLALAAELWLTGALHEDGLADFSDAFGGAWTRQGTLEILKDSRIGAYGALALLIALALRGGAMFEILSRAGLSDWRLWGSALLAAAALGRWVFVLMMVCVPPLQNRESLANAVAGRLSPRALAAASLLALPAVLPFAILMPQRCLLAVGLLAPTLWFFMRAVRQRLGGMTGDCLGCIGYVSQLLVLLAAAARVDPWFVIP